MNQLREWGKAHNYPYGAFVLHTENERLVKTLSRRKGWFGVMVYSKNGKDVAWDLIFPKKADKKYNYRLKKRLLAQYE